MSDVINFQSLFLDQIREMVTVTDLDGTIVYVNVPHCNELNFDRRELIGRHVSAYGENIEKGASQEEIIRKTLADGEWRGEVVNYAKDGSEIILDCHTWVIKDENEKPKYLCGVSRDITRQKNTELSLKLSQEKLMFAMESAGEGMWEIDFKRNTVRFDELGFRMLGFESGEVDKSLEWWLNRIHPDDRKASVDAFNGYIAGELPSYSREFRLKCKSGDYIWVASTGRIIQRDHDGKPSIVVGIHRNISDKKASDLERSLLDKRLMQTQKLEAVGQLAGGIAHDFNNILQYVMGNAQMLQEIVAENPEAAHCVSEIIKGSRNAARLTRKLLAFSRRQPIEPRAMDLNETIGTMLSIIRRTIGVHIRVEFQPMSVPCRVHADSGQVEHIIMNLCVNSRDAMPDGGEIRIEILEESPDGNIPLKEVGESGYFCMKISDTGTGMDEETLSRAFEPFFSTKPFDRASGLGLSMVYGIVEQHEGQIRLYSEIGRGTVVKVYLPKTGMSAPESSGRHDGKDPGGEETILVAEDNDAVRALIMRFLTKAGYRVIEAVDGDDAVRIGENRIDEINLLLLDMVMPGRSGRAVADTLREIKPGIPVLFSSGYSGENLRGRLNDADGIRMIQKPYRRGSLLKLIRTMLDGDKQSDFRKFNVD